MLLMRWMRKRENGHEGLAWNMVARMAFMDGLKQSGAWMGEFWNSGLDQKHAGRSWSVLIPVALFSAGFLILGGCAGGPKAVRSQMHEDGPSQWVAVTGGVEKNADSAVSGFAADGWLDAFADVELDRWVRRALDNSPDVRLARSRVEASMELARMEAAGLYPTLSAYGSGERRFSGPGMSGESYGESSVYGWGLQTSWELDVWGRVRDSAGGAREASEAAAYDLAGVRLSMAGMVARSWYGLLAARDQRDLARDTLSSYEASTELVRHRYESGVAGVSALDLRLARATTEGARAVIADREAEFSRSVKAFQVLVGDYPDGRLDRFGDWPDPGTLPLCGQPSSLLQRRPDLLAAERRLLAAEAQAGAARKARMPKVVFQAEGGVVADDTADLGDTDFRQWNAGVRVNQSLWSGGRMAAESGYADRLLEQASIEYGQVVNQAFFEVEQGLVADRLLADKADAVAASVEHAVAAEELAWEQYGSGLVDIITALEAHRRALSAREGMIEVRKERMISRINLLLALGGSLFRENSISSGGDDR